MATKVVKNIYVKKSSFSEHVKDVEPEMVTVIDQSDLDAVESRFMVIIKKLEEEIAYLKNN